MRCLSCGAKNRSGRTVCARCSAPLDPKVAVFGGAARSVRAGWGLAASVEEEPEQPVRRRWPVVAGLAGALAVTGACVWAFVWGPLAAPAGTALDESGFPDAALVEALERYDLDANGYLSTEEAQAVTSLSLADLGIESLAGIEAFTNLEVLDASGNKLGEVDLSGLHKLTAVDLSNNRIGSLSLAGHAELLALDVADNGLTAIDLSGCGVLQSLDTTGNEIAQLDLTGCVALTSLSADDGQNVTLPISEGFFPDAGLRAALAAADPDANGALTQRERDTLSSLTVSDPDTASLYGLTWMGGLTELDVSGTALSTLDADDLPAGLVTLTARDCQITVAQLDGLDHLTMLDLSGNPLGTLDLTVLPRLTTLKLADCSLAGALDLTANPRLSSADLTGNPALGSVDIRGLEDLGRPGALACDDGVEVLTGREESTEEEQAEEGA